MTADISRRQLLSLLASGAGALATGGCYAHATTEPVLVEAHWVPPRVHLYPSVLHHGHTVYLISGRWYTRRHGDWVYYRREPAVLRRERLRINQAPRAPDRRYRDYDRRDYDRRDYDRRDHDRRRYDRGDRGRGRGRRTPRSAPPARRVD